MNIQAEARGAPDLDYVKSYYDERVEGKLLDFTRPNPRIEAAIQTLAEWAPANPRRVLEIGCGIGATSWRMARAWPRAEVVGVDISPTSIEVAETCFRRPNLTYRAGLITEGVSGGKFDLILLMDVYEHIAPEDRAALHAAVKSLLSDESRLVITVPTPATQEYARVHDPSGLQPIDEDINIDDIKRMARETATELLYYRIVGVWDYGDYAHVVLGRYRRLAKVARREYSPAGIAALKLLLKGWLGIGAARAVGLYDYLGLDFGRSSPGKTGDCFKVSSGERKRLESLWRRRRLH
jgi:SAM-dependent methyltransferase